MYTSCPTCHTVFRLHPDQLGVANGLVRCGVCDQSFLALGRLYESLDDVPRVTPPADVVPVETDTLAPPLSSAPPAAQPAPAEPPPSIEPPPSTERNPATEPPPPTAPGPASTTAPPAEASGTIAQPAADERVPGGETPAVVEGRRSEPVVPSGFALEEEAEEPELHVFADDMPPILKADLEAEAQRRHPGVVVAGILAGLVLLAGLGVQYVYYNRATLAGNPQVRPWLVRLCGAVGCELPLPRDPQRLELLSRDVHSDPNANKALLISATFVNRAPFRQAYPLLGVRFSNVSGALIAARYFKPAEYLSPGSNIDAGIASGATVHVSFAVSDPGKKAVSYELNFR